MIEENNLSENTHNNHSGIMEMVSHIVAAYVSNNTVKPSDLPALMQQVQHSLCSKKSFFLFPAGTPAVPIEKSITPDYIICLEDGKQMKMLKRHLKTSYGMTPEQYRARWSLPANYPMVAHNYAKKRQGIAKTTGLGTNRKNIKQVA